MNKIRDYSSTNLVKYQCQHPFAIKAIGRFYDSIVKLIALVRPANMLDIGCGEGFSLRNIYEKGGINIEYCCGLDLELEALRMAKKSLIDSQFDATNGDIYYLPFKLNRFDLILCLEVLEHLACPERILNKISQHFNGYCMFSVPNEPLYRLTRLLLFRLNIRRLGNHVEHVNNWSKKSFSRLIQRYFIIDQIVAPFPWTIVLCHKRET